MAPTSKHFPDPLAMTQANKNSAFFNDVTYVAPKVPTLYTALTTGAMSTNAQVYGDNTNAFVLKTGDVVEIVVNNMDGGKHPFHIHGHTTQVVFRPDDESGVYDPSNATYPAIPMKRDTMWVKPNSNMVLRFTADNPGVWLFQYVIHSGDSSIIRASY